MDQVWKAGRIRAVCCLAICNNCGGRMPAKHTRWEAELVAHFARPFCYWTLTGMRENDLSFCRLISKLAVRNSLADLDPLAHVVDHADRLDAGAGRVLS